MYLPGVGQVVRGATASQFDRNREVISLTTVLPCHGPFHLTPAPILRYCSGRETLTIVDIRGVSGGCPTRFTRRDMYHVLANRDDESRVTVGPGTSGFRGLEDRSSWRGEDVLDCRVPPELPPHFLAPTTKIRGRSPLRGKNVCAHNRLVPPIKKFATLALCGSQIGWVCLRSPLSIPFGLGLLRHSLWLGNVIIYICCMSMHEHV